jgi:hypothetical protein
LRFIKLYVTDYKTGNHYSHVFEDGSACLPAANQILSSASTLTKSVIFVCE